MRRCHALLLALTLACAPGGSGGSTDTSAADTTTDDTSAPTTGDTTPGTTAAPGSTSSTDSSGTGEPPDDGLRLHHLQAMGTHNSYHISPGPDIVDLDYTHRPLPEGLAAGARKFELDLYFRGGGMPIEVHHLDFIDEGSTCPLLAGCLQQLRDWSDQHPAHHLLYVMLEVKTSFNSTEIDGHLADLDATLLAAWPRERILAPDDVQGDAADLPTALAERGWPTIDAARGKILFVLHDGENWRARYVQGGLAGKLLFPDAFGDLTLPYAAVHSINDAIVDADLIAEVVDAGHLVRTRADADNVEPLAGDYTRAEAALASGATFISTDYPPPGGDLDYVFSIPEGNPSRCNPRTAPPDCTARQIEDL